MLALEDCGACVCASAGPLYARAELERDSPYDEFQLCGEIEIEAFVDDVAEDPLRHSCFTLVAREALPKGAY